MNEIGNRRSPMQEMSDRSREIFRLIVESFLETGEPIGSRTLAQKGVLSLSPASIRNVMSDLEHMGLVTAAHVSAGRMPTEAGLRLFIDGLLEVGNLSEEERSSIEARIAGSAAKSEELLTQATSLLSGLSHMAGLVVTEKREVALKHAEFVAIAPGRTLVVLIGEDGSVENRIIETPAGLLPSSLIQATNYLSARLSGKTLDQARNAILNDLQDNRAELDTLSAKLVQSGIAQWSGAPEKSSPSLIVRGQAKLLEDVSAAEDLERIRRLFEDIEQKSDLIGLLDSAKTGDGVRIFIGSENKLFSLSGSSIIAAPYRDSQQRVIGVIGVLGPTRMNYARIIPMVDFTAKLVGRLIGNGR